MTRFATLAGAALALAGLAACDDGAMPMSGATETVPAQMPPSPAAPPFITTFDALVSDAAVSACRTALAAETNGGVDVVGTEFSEANVAVFMRVGANGAPWRCLAGNDGSGVELMFMGSEGDL